MLLNPDTNSASSGMIVVFGACALGGALVGFLIAWGLQHVFPAAWWRSSARSYNQPVLDLGDGDLALGPFDIMPDGYGAPLADAFVRMNAERFDPQLVEQFLRFGNREAE
jgi:hypothetical protein